MASPKPGYHCEVLCAALEMASCVEDFEHWNILVLTKTHCYDFITKISKHHSLALSAGAGSSVVQKQYWDLGKVGAPSCCPARQGPHHCLPWARGAVGIGCSTPKVTAPRGHRFASHLYLQFLPWAFPQSCHKPGLFRFVANIRTQLSPKTALLPLFTAI